ncbi:hypothetical protein ACFYXJ_06070 [Streptomyces sp. NPDC002667]|uniref:hypothetical protein n=1 Tax=Streptomyces sp. NPDC002667 TaxID=3364657 RepID=UPI0036BFE301
MLQEAGPDPRQQNDAAQPPGTEGDDQVTYTTIQFNWKGSPEAAGGIRLVCRADGTG